MKESKTRYIEQRENLSVYTGRESGHNGTPLLGVLFGRPNRGGMTAPVSWQSDGPEIPNRVSRRLFLRIGEDTDTKQTATSEFPHGIGVTGAWHSLHSSACKPKFPALPPFSDGGKLRRSERGGCHKPNARTCWCGVSHV